MRRTPQTVFVLSGGASLGALQVGMLRALFEAQIKADMLICTSVGAINAAYLASRPQTGQTINEFALVWHELRRDDAFPISPSKLIGALLNHRDHLVSERPLRRLIGRHLELERLEHAEVPLHLVAFDLPEGEEVRLSKGSTLEGVLAAAAIPGVFPPVLLDGRLLVDGGVVDNTPIFHAVELGAERIYVLPTQDHTARALGHPPRDVVDAAVYAFTLLVDARLQTDLERYASAAELIVLPAGNPDHVQPTNFDHPDRLINAAHRAARKALNQRSTPRRAAA